MVVYNPKKKKIISNNSSSNEVTNYCQCPCPKPQEACITIEVDGTPEICADVLYGPPGKDGLINGYNEVTINSGSNIEVTTNKNEIIINSNTYIEDINAEPCDCDCGCECSFEQAKPRSMWSIQHNLNKYPSVTVVDEYGTEIVCEVKHISKNEVHLCFNGKFRGTAYLN